MKRFFQFSSYVLVLLMLAPPAFATMQCGRNPEKTNCPKPCCDGMDEMSMPMDRDASVAESGAQIGSAPCCTVEQSDALQPGAPTDSFTEDAVALVALPAALLPVNFEAGNRRIVEFPPGDAPREPVLSQLCSLQI